MQCRNFMPALMQNCGDSDVCGAVAACNLSCQIVHRFLRPAQRVEYKSPMHSSRSGLVPRCRQVTRNLIEEGQHNRTLPRLSELTGGASLPLGVSARSTSLILSAVMSIAIVRMLSGNVLCSVRDIRVNNGNWR